MVSLVGGNPVNSDVGHLLPTQNWTHLQNSFMVAAAAEVLPALAFRSQIRQNRVS